MQVHCPGCSQVISISEMAPGSTASCPLCTTMFLVPDVRAAAATETSQQETQEYAGDPLLYERIHQRRSQGMFGSALWTLVVLLFFGGILGGAIWAVYSLSQKDTASPVGGDWQSIGSFSGTTGGATDVIELPGGDCLVQWESRTQKNPTNIHMLNISLHDSRKDLVQRIASTRSASKHKMQFHLEPGTYYFYVESLAMSWQVDVYFDPKTK